MSLSPLSAPRWRRGTSADRGSVPLALLASIVTAGLITVVVATVLAGENAVQFDEGFTGAVHVAEVGVQDAMYQLNTGTEDISGGGSGEVDGKSYTWTAERHGDYAWSVRSTGEGAHGVERTVEGVLADDPVFAVSAFADQAIDFAGSNMADSYNSVDQTWCTGNGRVGSNDELVFSGDDVSAATCTYDTGKTVDGVDLHDWDNNPGWPDTSEDRCVHGTGPPDNCKEDSTTPAFEMHPDPLEFTDELGWVDDVLGHTDCDPDTGSQWVDTWRTTEQHEGMVSTADGNEAGTVSPAGTDYPRLWAGDSDSPRAYCVGTLWFDEHTVLKNAAPYDPDDTSGDGPVVFVVRDEVLFERSSGEKSVAVNCGGCHPGEDTWVPTDTAWAPNPVYPKSGALHIYMKATSSVSSRQHSRIAAGVYTPNSECRASGGSAAGVHVFGALVCQSVTNQGGWQFHYDDALRDQLRTGRFSTDRLSEE